MKSVVKILSELYVGKKLKSLEYVEDGDDRSQMYGQVIRRVSLGFDEFREDPVVWLHLDSDDVVFVYGSEGIEVED